MWDLGRIGQEQTEEEIRRGISEDAQEELADKEAERPVAHDALHLVRAMAPTEPRDRSRLIARGLQGLSVRVQTRLAELLLSAERRAGAF